MVRYYLSRNDRALDIAFEEGPEEWLGGHRIVIPSTAPQAFRPIDAVEEVTDAARMIGVPPGDPLLWFPSPGRSRHWRLGFHQEKTARSRNLG